MHLEIHPATLATLPLIDQFDKSFVTNARLVLTLEQNKIIYEIVPITPFTKTYPDFSLDYDTYLTAPDKIIYFAFADAVPAGQIFIREHWNRLAYIENFVVNANVRQHGIGRALMDQAIAWAKQRNLPGIMLETQDINVTACKFYARMGLHIGGFDQDLYTAFHFDPPETALFWYRFF